MRNDRQPDYSSKADRQAIEARWDLLQKLRTYSGMAGNPASLTLPIAQLDPKNRGEGITDAILSGLSEQGLFTVAKKPDSYLLASVDYRKLEEIYKKTESEYGKYALSYRIKTKAGKKELGKVVDEIIKTKSFGKKEAQFLQTLSDFQLHKASDLAESVGTNRLAQLKLEVSKKLNGTILKIKTVGGRAYETLYYQLD